MPELLTESFCERCGTRYTFEAPETNGGRAGRLKQARTLARGLRNFVLDDDLPLQAALADARRDDDRVRAEQQLEAFHSTFNFCMDCRQYTCLECWNEAEGRCLSCAPSPGLIGRAGLELLPPPNGHAPALRPAVAEPISTTEPSFPAQPAFPIEPATASASPADPLSLGEAIDAPAEPLSLREAIDALAGPAPEPTDAEPIEAVSPERLAAIGGMASSPEGPFAIESLPPAELGPLAAETSPVEAASGVPLPGEPLPGEAPGSSLGPIALPSVPRARPVGPVRPEVPPPSPAAWPPPLPVAHDLPPAPARLPTLPPAQPASAPWPPLGSPVDGGPAWPTGPSPLAPPDRLPPLDPAVLQPAAGLGPWAASAAQVTARSAGAGIQSCVSCGLALSATARFCRRCGSRQAA